MISVFRRAWIPVIKICQSISTWKWASQCMAIQCTVINSFLNLDWLACHIMFHLCYCFYYMNPIGHESPHCLSFIAHILQLPDQNDLYFCIFHSSIHPYMYSYIRGWILKCYISWLIALFDSLDKHSPDSKVPGVNMGPIWGRQGPGGPHVGPINFSL